MRKIPLLFCLLSVHIASKAHAASIPPFPLPSLGRCFKISWKTWVLPSEARACMSGFPFKEDKRQNVLDVITKTLPFHASTNYQLHAPHPFDKDVQWDLLRDLEKMRTNVYSSDLEFHLDVQQSLRQVNDGHLMYANGCYDGVYITYNPFPLVLLTDPSDGSQAIHISPSAHEIASATFEKEVKFWEDDLKRPLQEFSGARIVRINGEDPFFAVNNNARITGSFQGLSSRQNSFFSTAIRGDNDWSYRLGDFAEQDLPLLDSVELTIQRVGADVEETITVPYRSKFNKSTGWRFLNRLHYERNFCRATKGTNGRNWYRLFAKDSQESPGPIRRRPTIRSTEIPLPEALKPSLTALEESAGSTQFYILNDATGVLVMGKFDNNIDDEEEMKCTLLRGLQKMHGMGVQKLVIDLTDNLGGFVCVAHFLHRLIFGETEQTYPQPGLDTTIRVSNIAQEIIKVIPRTYDPKGGILYNRKWRNATHQIIEDEEWFNPVKNITINGRQDVFGQRLGMECPISTVCMGKESLGLDPLFKAENIVLLSDGRCGSSCAVFSVLLAKKHGVRTVVVGGKSDVPQQYCGFVGGESVNFRDIDDTLKTAKLKGTGADSPDIPPDMIVNGWLTITWRLAYGVNKPDEPEEWQDHTATDSFPLTADIAHKPQKIWEAVARKVFPVTAEPQPILQVQLP